MKYFNKVLVFSRLSYRLKTYRCHNLHAKNGNNIFLNRVPVVFYSNMNDLDVKKRTEELTDSFMEARELMQDAVSVCIPRLSRHYSLVPVSKHMYKELHLVLTLRLQRLMHNADLCIKFVERIV